MKRFLSYYHPKTPVFLAYMLQQVEYNPSKFLKWVSKIPDLTAVMRRQQLVWTMKARLLVAIITVYFVFYMLLALVYLLADPLIGIVSLIAAPFFVVILTYIAVLAAWLYYEEPRRKTLLAKACKTFKTHPGIKIAIAGSYGKTTMKELLGTVLAEARAVAVTPGNKNVLVSHAAWVQKLSGQEDILLIEFGEGAPGDIKKLATLTQPDYAVITGLAPNHLDEYKTLDAVADDLLSLKDYVGTGKLFVDTSSSAYGARDLTAFSTYNNDSVMGWKIGKASVDLSGTTFVMQKGSHNIKVTSQLLGRHQIAPLALAAALAHQLGLTIKQIESGLSKTQPFEHRMQPRRQHGAWIIDDTYNGSLEGIRAGLALLSELPAKRKLYVTPGLVDQGEETERVHLEIGRLITEANPDRVVLMQNSVTQHIIRGMETGGYKGTLQIEADPLTFYTNLEHIIAAGDLVMMQNDWTDNYS